MGGDDFYGVAVADSGVPGPHRYVYLIYLHHWDMSDEEQYKNDGSKIADTYRMFTAEFTAPDVNAFGALSVGYVMKSIAWGLSFPTDEVAKDAIVGTWDWLAAPTHNADTRNSKDPWDGDSRFTFGADGTFELLIMYRLVCATTDNCLIQGTSKARARSLSRRRWRADPCAPEVRDQKLE